MNGPKVKVTIYERLCHMKSHLDLTVYFVENK